MKVEKIDRGIKISSNGEGNGSFRDFISHCQKLSGDENFELKVILIQIPQNATVGNAEIVFVVKKKNSFVSFFKTLQKKGSSCPSLLRSVFPRLFR